MEKHLRRSIAFLLYEPKRHFAVHAELGREMVLQTKWTVCFRILNAIFGGGGVQVMKPEAPITKRCAL